MRKTEMNLNKNHNHEIKNKNGFLFQINSFYAFKFK